MTLDITCPTCGSSKLIVVFSRPRPASRFQMRRCKACGERVRCTVRVNRYQTKSKNSTDPVPTPKKPRGRATPQV